MMSIPDLIHRHALVAMVDTTPTYAPPPPVVVANPCGDCGHNVTAHGDRAVVACDGGQPVTPEMYVGAASPSFRKCYCAGWRAV